MPPASILSASLEVPDATTISGSEKSSWLWREMMQSIAAWMVRTSNDASGPTPTHANAGSAIKSRDSANEKT